MAAHTFGLILSFLLWIVSLEGIKELTVICKLSEECVLPCQSQADHRGVRVMWIRMETGIVVSCERFKNTSFSKFHKAAADEFKGRTGMYEEDQVLSGNATLLLRNIRPSDEGRYICRTQTASGMVLSGIISLVVKDPVDKVDIQQVEKRISCSSQGIYPEPELTWSTSPPSNMKLHIITTTQQTAQLLYDISSSLIPPDTDADLSYSCTISTSRSRRKATLFKPTSMVGSVVETTIPCTGSNAPLTGLIWKFNHIQIILTQTRGDAPYAESLRVSERWRQQVKNVSESGSLMLQHLSFYHKGTYTCELSDAEETLVTNTFLMIKEEVFIWQVKGIAVGVAVILVALAAGAAAVVLWRHRNRRNEIV